MCTSNIHPQQQVLLESSSRFLPETKLMAAPRPTLLLEAMRLMKKTSTSSKQWDSSSRETKRRRISKARPPQEDTKKAKTQTRTVHFAAESTSTSTIPALFQVLTLQHSHELWYSSHDIQTFKSEAKRLLSSRPREGDEKEADTSGLERFTLERTWRKKRTIHALVQASSLQQQQQQQRRDSLDLLQRCNKNQRTHHGGRTTTRFLLPLLPVPQEYAAHALASQRRAIQQGFRDFCQVYDPLSSLFGHDDDDDDDDKTNYNELLFGGEPDEEESVGVVVTTTSIQLPLLSPSHSSPHLVVPRQQQQPPQRHVVDPLLQRLQQVREQQMLIQWQIDANTRAILR